MSDAEKKAVEEAGWLLRHIEEQIEKRQYLNAAHASADLTRALLAAFSAVLKEP